MKILVARWTPGVYSLEHVPSGNKYIGSTSRCIQKRVLVHRSLLNRKKHKTFKLQELWNNTQESEWRVILLESCAADRTARETYWINNLDQILNTHRDANGLGSNHSPETKVKIASKLKKYCEKAEVRAKFSETMKRRLANGEIKHNCGYVSVYRVSEGRYGAYIVRRKPEKRIWLGRNFPTAEAANEARLTRLKELGLK